MYAHRGVQAPFGSSGALSFVLPQPAPRAVSALTQQSCYPGLVHTNGLPASSSPWSGHSSGTQHDVNLE